MPFKLRIVFSVFFACVLFQDGIAQVISTQQVEYQVRFRSYDYERNNICIVDDVFPVKAGIDTLINWGQAKWQLKFKETVLATKDKIKDLHLDVICLSGNLQPSSISLELHLKNWNVKNFVLMPSAAYNGNRFISRKIPYSPRILLPQDAGLQAPLVISDVPRLNNEDGFSRIQERSGGMSLPCLGYLDSLSKIGYFLISPQSNQLGDYGIEIEENRNRNRAFIRITSPLVRELYSYKIGDNQTPSIDKAHVFKKDELITIEAKLHSLHTSSLKDFYAYYFSLHQQYLKSAPAISLQLPMSKAFQLIENKYNDLNWNEQNGFYAIDAHTGNKKWKPGWVGGQITAYALLYGNDTTSKRILRENDWLFPAGITKAGFFYERCINGTQWISGDPSKFHTQNWHLIRSSADALYYTIKQLEWYKQQKGAKDSSNIKNIETSVKRVSDAFVRTWKLYGQWGHFVNSEDGSVAVGGSASAALAPAALLKAAQWFKDTSYVAVAKQAARDYYQNFIQKGITTGGPGDALQSPDSESCFALLESFMALYQATGEKEWIAYAEETAHQFSTWVMPYQYDFPEGSLMHKLKVSTTGTVWANVQNKHAAPGICTASGLPLLQLYQATKNEEYLELLKWITQSALQFVSHPNRPIAKQPIGVVDERISTTDWYEGIGEIEGLSTWSEVAILLMYAELPGIYIDAEKNRLWTLDHVIASIDSSTNHKILTVSNPTAYVALVKVAVDSQNLSTLPTYQKIVLQPNETRKWHIQKYGTLKASSK